MLEPECLQRAALDVGRALRLRAARRVAVRRRRRLRTRVRLAAERAHGQPPPGGVAAGARRTLRRLLLTWVVHGVRPFTILFIFENISSIREIRFTLFILSLVH